MKLQIIILSCIGRYQEHMKMLSLRTIAYFNSSRSNKHIVWHCFCILCLMYYRWPDNIDPPTIDSPTVQILWVRTAEIINHLRDQLSEVSSVDGPTVGVSFVGGSIVTLLLITGVKDFFDHPCTLYVFPLFLFNSLFFICCRWVLEVFYFGCKDPRGRRRNP